ncbi:MAG: AAA family ATPase [Nanoarchaeota archaeon]
MIITFSGMPGSGKSTIAKKAVEKLGLKRFYTGGVLRKMAKEHSMDIQTFLDYLEQHPDEERRVDEQIYAQARTEEKDSDILAEGRVAFHFLPESIKVFFDVTIEEGTHRIYNQMQGNNDRNEKHYISFDEALIATKKRLDSEKRRYKALYNIDVYDRSNYDIVIDTTGKPIDEVKHEFFTKLKNLTT